MTKSPRAEETEEGAGPGSRVPAVRKDSGAARRGPSKEPSPSLDPLS